MDTWRAPNKRGSEHLVCATKGIASINLLTSEIPVKSAKIIVMVEECIRQNRLNGAAIIRWTQKERERAVNTFYCVQLNAPLPCFVSAEKMLFHKGTLVMYIPDN